MKNLTILCIDDEQHILDLLNFYLKAQAYDVLTALNGADGLRAARRIPSLILLDLTLPDMDGTEVCRKLKANPVTASIPIIIVSARADETNKIICLNLGADDYITKPFSTKELISRMKTVIKCYQPVNTGIINIGPLSIDADKKAAFRDGKKLQLTPTEYMLLKLLASHPGKLFTRDLLLEAIGDRETSEETRVVDMHIRNLRRKLQDNRSLIQTVWRVGYRMRSL